MLIYFGILYNEDGTKRIADNTLVALTLMIADGKALPRDLDTKKYKVLVRFVKK